MNRTEEEVVDIIEDVVMHYMDWQDGEQESTSKSSSTVYFVDHLNATNNTSSPISNIGKEMTSIKAKLESTSSQAPVLPSQNKGRGLEPKKTVYSITTRSGKVLQESVSRRNQESEKVSDSSNDDEHYVSSKKCEVSKEKAKMGESVQNEVRKPKHPYPQKFLRNKIDVQFGRFLDMLKKIHLSIPFIDTLKQMPNYSKFLKDILSGKRECNEIDSVKVGECCSALIYNDLAKKMKDPGELNMTLQLAGRPIKFPKGRIADVPLNIGEFTILVDYIVLDIAKVDNIPIILWRPFLETSGALIDVKGGIIACG
ncbi:uncharacterized protein LOC110706278 [Chenopodium quinoa]|uniref:uncharacterized protein LOC110706278 n=1 Tax=Chenopodium quinoa TaxID=63459 RepID=UPI000B775FBE|nr:uncharacterized protein LOC110706278 [Chenopodium quinoa]